MGLQNNGALPTVIKSSAPGSGIGYSAAAVVNPVVDGPGIIINATAAALNPNTGTVYGIAVGTNGTVPFILQDSDITDDSGWNIVLPSAELGVFVSAAVCRCRTMRFIVEQRAPTEQALPRHLSSHKRKMRVIGSYPLPTAPHRAAPVFMNLFRVR